MCIAVIQYCIFNFCEVEKILAFAGPTVISPSPYQLYRAQLHPGSVAELQTPKVLLCPCSAELPVLTVLFYLLYGMHCSQVPT